MQITINFFESAKFTTNNVENFIPARKAGITLNQLNSITEIGQELETYINDNYFNGAEYQGFDLTTEVFNFQLNPN